MQAAAEGHGHRRARVPLVLAAGVGVAVDLAPHDGHGLGAGRAHLHQLAVEALGQQRRGLGRRTGAADHDAAAVGPMAASSRTGSAVASTAPRAGRATAPATGAAVDAQRDVDGPVGAGRLAELPGAVERIDDPDPLGAEADAVVVGPGLLGEHGVAGCMCSVEPGQEQVVGAAVALVLELAGLGAARRPAGRAGRRAARRPGRGQLGLASRSWSWRRGQFRTLWSGSRHAGS